MPWIIVKQPNDKYARFSTIVDDFTHMNLTRNEVLDLCTSEYQLNESQALEKLRGADKNLYLDCYRVKGSESSRWEACLNTIDLVHGKSQVDKNLNTMKSGDMIW